MPGKEVKRRMNDQKGKTEPRDIGDKSTRPKSVSRRALIKGGVTVMPAILTLQSGAALARTSNLISAAAPGTTDRLGRTICLDTNSVYPAGGSGDVYDLDEPPRADVNIITDREYHLAANRGSDQISESAMCEGGTYWYNDHNGEGWQSVELPYRGIVVSSGAMTSIADHVIDTLM